MACFFYFYSVHAFRKITDYIFSFYKLDPRAISLMRIGIACVIFADLSIRAGDLVAHYTDQGLWPIRILTNFGWKEGYWSLFILNGSTVWAIVLFAVHFILAGFLLVGFRTRMATLLLWLLYISLHNRNLFIQQAGDDLLRLILLWGIFLPWNAHYSFDNRSRNITMHVNAFANLGYLFLLAGVYFFAAILKSGSDWYATGNAVYYALSLDQLRLPGFGDWLYRQPVLMKLSTWFVLGSELLTALFIILPSKKGYLRFAAFLLLIILHSGIGLSLYVGLFFVIGLVSALGLLPGAVMDWLEKKLHLKAKEIIIHPKQNVLVTSICSLLLITSLIINLSTVPGFNYNLKSQLLVPANALRLDQYWGMFSPYVLKKDGWMVYYGVDSIGRQWDLRLNQDYVDFSKPEHVTSMYKSDRWRKLAENMQGSGTFLRPLYGKYVLKKWNREHPEKKISTLNLYFMQKENLENYKTTPLTKILYCVCIED